VVPFPSGQEIVLSSIAPRQALSNGYPEYEAVVCEDDLSSLSIAELKNGGAMPPLPIYFHGVGLH
jgi:hypothetical protein